MSYPEHPETIILRNKFYPKGLREIDVWNYYQKVKRSILEETRNRDLMFIIMVDTNKPIIKRKSSTGGYLRLNSKNYDTLITGRTLSIHSAMGMYEDFGILDIDVDPRDGFRWSREATIKTYEFIMDKVPLVTSASIRFTGKTSFHIKCDFGRKIKIDRIQFLLEKFLKHSELSKVYLIGGKRTPGIPNIDIRNCLRCNYITLNALSILGLRSIEVPYNKIKSFNPQMARIK